MSYNIAQLSTDDKNPHDIPSSATPLNITVRIDNSFPLETQAQGCDLSPDPESLWAAGPEDQGAACLQFSGVKPLRAEAKNNGPNGKQAKLNESLNQIREHQGA
ncbi:hypothetical protein DSO57_1024877 [Entomophthora muscae]|uniref:Uncharacterized protein n=1 Tax=Entomophthora muscae TaxID=34485 RepID=A0ACC2RTI6_9FUNG|nr:hypothetical protein DSO57_1024877 [Entomophthora muscae]